MGDGDFAHNGLRECASTDARLRSVSIKDREGAPAAEADPRHSSARLLSMADKSAFSGCPFMSLDGVVDVGSKGPV